MRQDVRRSVPLMGTIVTIQAPSGSEESIEKSFDWFRRVEAACSRFNSESELMQLTARVGASVSVSELLFGAIHFAVSVAEETNGAFDPTVGYAMEQRGYNRDYSTGLTVQTPIETSIAPTFRDIVLDGENKTITLLRPLVLDLGAVAKGMAIDLAVRELFAFENFSVNAGGDLYLGGLNPHGRSWRIGIRHPRVERTLIDAVSVSNRAVCTSGDYERGDHILDPRSGGSANLAASVTVIASTAMLADALATAAFVLGPQKGIELLKRVGVDGLIVSQTLDEHATEGMSSDYSLGSSAIL